MQICQLRSWRTRRTSPVIARCRAAAIRVPDFKKVSGAAIATFQVNVAGAARRTPQVTPQVARVLEAAKIPRTREELQQAAGISHREHFRTAYLLPLLSAGWLERTIPDKPRSRMQRYRTTEAGREAMAREGG